MTNPKTNFLFQLRVFFLFFFVSCGVNTLQAETETIDLSAGVYDTDTKSITWQGSSCSIVQVKGSGTYVNNAYISDPRWYKYHKVSFVANKGCEISKVVVVCTTSNYATELKNSTYSENVSKKSLSSKTVTITTSGDFSITLGSVVYVSSISVTYTKSDVPTVVTSTKTIDFGVAEISDNISQSFTLSGSNLLADLSLNISGDNSNNFTINPTSIAHASGEVATTQVEVNYLPTTIGTHSATINIISGEETLATVSLVGKVATTHNIVWMVNGEQYTAGNPTTKVAEGEKVSVLPDIPSAIGDNNFVGWTTKEITTEQTSVPSDLFSSTTEAPTVNADATYYAVFATKGTESGWQKIPVSEISEGTYLITNNAGNYFTGKITSDKGEMSTDIISFDSNASLNVPDDACEITIKKSETEGGYLLYNPSRGYLYASAASSGNLAWHKSESSYWYYNADKSGFLYAACNAFLRVGTANKLPCLNTYGTKFGDELFLAKMQVGGSYRTTITSQPIVYTPQTQQFIAHNANGYWATMSNSQPLFIPSAITVSTVVVENEQLLINSDAFGQPTAVTINGEQISGVYIPANTGILLSSKSQEATYYTVSNLSSFVFLSPLNMLKPAPVGGGVFADDADYMFYKLAYEDYAQQTGLGFYWGADEGGVFNIKANTAYLAVPYTDANNAKSFIFDGSTTAIHNTSTISQKHSIYSVYGTKVESTTRPGLYIVDGKKIVR